MIRSVAIYITLVCLCLAWTVSWGLAAVSEPPDAVLCCCEVSGGGICCANVIVCGGDYIPGCYCK